MSINYYCHRKNNLVLIDRNKHDSCCNKLCFLFGFKLLYVLKVYCRLESHSSQMQLLLGRNMVKLTTYDDINAIKR